MSIGYLPADAFVNSVNDSNSQPRINQCMHVPDTWTQELQL